jgi:hypothetical protein
MEQQLILQRGQAMLTADILAIPQKTAQPITKVREPFEVFFLQHAGSPRCDIREPKDSEPLDSRARRGYLYHNMM